MTNHCGTCTACCRIFDIPELSKPAGKWCDHCAIGRGCQIYDSRPPICRGFKCLWLMSQEREDPRERMPVEMRPDKSKVVFHPSTNDNIMAATTMPGAPLAWRNHAAQLVIKRLVANGNSVAVGAPVSNRRVMVDKDGEHEVRMTDPDETGMQFMIPEEQQ